MQPGASSRGFCGHPPDPFSLPVQNCGNIDKPEHNQFVNINRSSGVELRVTPEAFGHDHKQKLLSALRENGLNALECNTNDFYTT